MSQNATTGFIKYLNEASQTVSNWPEWKKNGSDAAKLQVDNRKLSTPKSLVLAKKS